jgi:hypothetical protein
MSSEADIMVARLRKQAALEIDRLVEFLDRTDGYSYDEREDDDEDDGNADDEPSLGSLDRRMNQTTWARADYTPRGCWEIVVDAEDDGLVRGEGDEADREGGIEDMPHDGELWWRELPPSAGSGSTCGFRPPSRPPKTSGAN